MSPLTTVAQVFDAVQQAKAGASAFCTNFFPAQGKLQAWINHGELFGELRDRSAFFLRNDRDFGHLYFCASDIATLQQHISALPCLKTERVAVDLVGREAALRELLNAVESGGFRPYTRLLRLARPGEPAQPPSAAEGAEVFYPERTDCQSILNLLESAFDRYADQLPALYELEAAMAARQVLAIKCDGALAALLFFETQGLTSTVRFWVVDPRFRSHRFGSALMRHYFAAHHSVRRFVLWVTAANENAVSKYRHYGYAPDGLVDHVLVNWNAPL